MAATRPEFADRFDILSAERPHRIFLAQLALLALTLGGAWVLAVMIGLAEPWLELPFPMLSETVPPDHARVDLELSQRIAWGVMVLAFLATALVTIANGLRVIDGALRDGGRKRSLWLAGTTAGALLLIFLGVLLWRVHWGPKVYGDLLDTIFQPRRPPDLLATLGLVLGTAYASALLVWLGSFASVLPPERGGWSPDVLRERLKGLLSLLYSGAALLTLGVMAMGVLFRWTAMYFTSDSAKVVLRLGESLTLGVGFVCTLVLAVCYELPALALRRRVDELAPQGTPKARKAWLEENDLALSPTGRLFRVASALAPTILGSQLPGLVSALGGVLGG